MTHFQELKTKKGCPHLAGCSIPNGDFMTGPQKAIDSTRPNQTKPKETDFHRRCDYLF